VDEKSKTFTFTIDGVFYLVHRQWRHISDRTNVWIIWNGEPLAVSRRMLTSDVDRESSYCREAVRVFGTTPISEARLFSLA
jgi:hypothetical protein